MNFWKKLFGGDSKPKASSEFTPPIAATLGGEIQTKPFYQTVKNSSGQVTGIWVAEPDHPNLKARLQVLIVAEGMPVEQFAAFMEGRYRAVPNQVNDLGGAFLMFGKALAPGEHPTRPTIKVGDRIRLLQVPPSVRVKAGSDLSKDLGRNGFWKSLSITIKLAFDFLGSFFRCIPDRRERLGFGHAKGKSILPKGACLSPHAPLSQSPVPLEVRPGTQRLLDETQASVGPV